MPAAMKAAAVKPEARKDFAIRLLKQHGTVTMGMVADMAPARVYTFRNAVAEAKAELAGEDYVVSHSWGRTWRENSYTLKRVEVEAPRFEGAQRVFA